MDSIAADLMPRSHRASGNIFWVSASVAVVRFAASKRYFSGDET